jgi:glutaredoxin 3
VVRITVYTTDWCGYCAAAKSLLGRIGLEFTEINLTGDPERKAALKEKYGSRTVPIILVGERFIGGFRELSKLEKSGELDALLSGEETEP